MRISKGVDKCVVHFPPIHDWWLCGLCSCVLCWVFFCFLKAEELFPLWLPRRAGPTWRGLRREDTGLWGAVHHSCSFPSSFLESSQCVFCLFDCFVFFLMFTYLKGVKRGRKTGRDPSRICLWHTSQPGLNPPPKHVPWPRIELAMPNQLSHTGQGSMCSGWCGRQNSKIIP